MELPSAFIKSLGPGFPEKIYQRALSGEFNKQKIPFNREEKFQVYYDGKNVGYEIMDFCTYDKIAVELKTTREILDLHSAQLISYLKGRKIRLGLILNFGKSKLEIKRVIL